MTAARQKRKQYCDCFAAAACVVAVLSVLAPPAHGGLTQRIVVEWHSGLAIGGYDPDAVARGVAVAGDPDVWTIVGERLFPFYNGAQREKFLADSARFIATSQRKWPQVMRTLDPQLRFVRIARGDKARD